METYFMSVQLKFFWLSCDNSEETENELNQFLQTVRVVSLEREFLAKDSQICIILKYKEKQDSVKQNKASKIDYREVLSPEDFSLYAKIRDWRKAIAKTNGLQLYTVLTNEQMATIAREQIITKQELEKVEGIGKSRLDNYGDKIIEIVKKEIEEREKLSTQNKKDQNKKDQMPKSNNEKTTQKEVKSSQKEEKKNNETNRLFV